MTSRGHAGEPQISDVDLPDEEVSEDVWWDTGTIADAVVEVLEESEDSARVYLRESWLAATMGLLRECRRRAGLTQTEVADLMGTKQPAIARLERADDTTLGRFWDYLSACGKAPLEIETVPVSALRRYALADVDAPRTAAKVSQWLNDETEARPLLPGARQATSYQWITFSPDPPKAPVASTLRSYSADLEKTLNLCSQQTLSLRNPWWVTNLVVSPTVGQANSLFETAMSAETLQGLVRDCNLSEETISTSKGQNAPAAGDRPVNERVAA